MIYVVQPGDTLYSISQTFGVSIESIETNNGLAPGGDRLVVGQALLILIPEQVYTVQPGDTLYSISEATGIPVNEILRKNVSLNEQDILVVGQELVLVYEGEENKIRQEPVSVSGYAYPFIDRQVFEQTLPFLERLFVFSYGFTETGELIEPDDAYLRSKAEEYGVDTMLVLTSMNREGRFSNQLVNLLMEDMEVQDAVVGNIRQQVLEKNFAGVDLDFEYILASDRQAYVDFANRMAQMLHPLGKTLSIALPPKVSADQPGLLYEGMDYGGLGAAADEVLLMTYEWGYKYGPPMAVAPIPQVEKVLQYAVSEIPPEKINLGIPNYAYDWPLPYVKGETAAETIGNQQAVEIAMERSVGIQYDENAKSPYFRYFDENGTTHEVWFEDVRSIEEKAKLVEKYGFAGMEYWNLMRPFTANWLLVDQIFNI